MLRGIDTSEVVEFVSKSDEGESKTVFLIGNISHRDKLKLFENSFNQDGSVNVGEVTLRALDIIKAGLRGIKNLNGKDYPVVDDAVLDRLDFAVIGELAEKVVEFNRLGSSEKKT